VLPPAEAAETSTLRGRSIPGSAKHTDLTSTSQKRRDSKAASPTQGTPARGRIQDPGRTGTPSAAFSTRLHGKSRQSIDRGPLPSQKQCRGGSLFRATDAYPPLTYTRELEWQTTTNAPFQRIAGSKPSPKSEFEVF